MTWRDEVRTCDCGMVFIPKREAQRYCSPRCRNTAVVRRKRSGDKTQDLTVIAGSGDMPASEAPSAFSDGSTMVWPERPSMEGLNPDGSTPGALPGNYPLEYDVNGFHELPACLDRRPIRLAEAA